MLDGDGYLLNLTGPIGFNIGIIAPVSDRIDLEGGMCQTVTDIGMHDVSYMDRVDYTGESVSNNYSRVGDGNFETWRVYNGPYLNAYYYFPVPDSYAGFYLSVGASYNALLDRTRFVTLHSRDETSGETLTMNVTYPATFTAVYLEAGGYFLGESRRERGACFYMGVKFGLSATKAAHGDYQSSINGNTLYQDQFDLSGTYVGLTAKFAWGMWRARKHPTKQGRL